MEKIEVNSRARYISKGVSEKVDNLLQHFIWTQIVDKVKLTAEEMLEIKVTNCVCSDKVHVKIEDTLERNIENEYCFNVIGKCGAEIIIFYDEEHDYEVMILREEAEELHKERENQTE